MTYSPKEITVNDLKLYVDGLNIEGGFPGQDCKVKWVSHVTILDDPIRTKVTFDQLLKEVNENKYPMLENGVKGINEPRYLASYLAIMGYYMAKHNRITVHVHQFPDQCGWLVDQLKSYVKLICDEFKFENKEVDFRTDNPFYQRQTYNCEVLISLSQCAGVGSTMSAEGDMIAADTFIPFDVKSGTMQLSKKYKVENTLIKDQEDLLSSIYLRFAILHFKDYKSANLDKSHKVPDNKSDFVFYHVPLLQAGGIWNPKSGKEVVKIE